MVPYLAGAGAITVLRRFEAGSGVRPVSHSVLGGCLPGGKATGA
jgi:hypothetical protein